MCVGDSGSGLMVVVVWLICGVGGSGSGCVIFVSFSCLVCTVDSIMLGPLAIMLGNAR